MEKKLQLVAYVRSRDKGNYNSANVKIAHSRLFCADCHLPAPSGGGHCGPFLLAHTRMGHPARILNHLPLALASIVFAITQNMHAISRTFIAPYNRKICYLKII